MVIGGLTRAGTFAATMPSSEGVHFGRCAVVPPHPSRPRSVPFGSFLLHAGPPPPTHCGHSTSPHIQPRPSAPRGCPPVSSAPPCPYSNCVSIRSIPVPGTAVTAISVTVTPAPGLRLFELFPSDKSQVQGVVYVVLTNIFVGKPDPHQLAVQTCVDKNSNLGTVVTWSVPFLIWAGCVTLLCIPFVALFWPKYKRREYEAIRARKERDSGSTESLEQEKTRL